MSLHTGQTKKVITKEQEARKEEHPKTFRILFFVLNEDSGVVDCWNKRRFEIMRNVVKGNPPDYLHCKTATLLCNALKK